MRKMLLRYGILVACIAVSGWLLMQTSQHVQRAEYEKRALEKQITQIQDEIEVLEAEWSYLNAPERLKTIAQDWLGMENAPVQDKEELKEALSNETQEGSDAGFISISYPGEEAL